MGLLAVGPLFLLAALAGAATTALMRRLLLLVRSIDYPRDDRWHDRPVARPGGPALYLPWILLLMLGLHGRDGPVLQALAVGGTLIFVIGLTDDLLRLDTVPKMLLLIVAACVPPLLGLRFEGFPPVIGIPLTIFWILGIANAFNWLDNIDGLAAGTAAIASLVLVVQFLGAGERMLASVAALTGGVALGFLVFNFHPARIFMGDSGSNFLGFILALLPVAGSAVSVSHVATTLIVPVLVLSVPIFDTIFVSVTRFLGGRPLLRGGTDHSSHRMVTLGLSERQAVLNLYLLSLLSGGVALAASRLPPLAGVVLVVVGLVLFTTFGLVLARVRVSAGPPVADGTRLVLTQLMYKRRILEMVVDVGLICAAYVGANLLRFEGHLPPSIADAMALSLPVIVALKITILYLMGMYRGEWRYVGFLDVVDLVRATALASLVTVAALVLATRLVNFSRAALILDWLLTMLLLGGARLSVRMVQEFLAAQRAAGRPVLIFGAGEGGLLLLAELRHNPGLAVRPVGFVDDNPLKVGSLIRGLQVLGTRRDIPALVRELAIAEVLIAAPTMREGDLEAVRTICSEAGVSCRTMHPLLT